VRPPLSPRAYGVSLVLALALTSIACSGVGGEPFRASAAGDASSPSSPSSPRDGVDAAVVPGHAQAAADAGAPDAEGAVPDGGGAPRDASVSVVDAASVDASPAVIAIACGVEAPLACAHPPDVCCVAYGTAARACVPAVACAGTPIACAGASDCATGQTCCGTYNRAAKRYDSVACATSCARSDETGFDVAFCALRNGDADCPAGQRCIPSMVYAGFAVCG
jgi:hypothetical protein